MKRLTRLRLINWHYFTDETLELSGSTLLTGDNGSGKSTILDAIQYALVGDSRRVRFNQSAHEHSQRDLEGYLRCKTGAHIGSGQTAAFLRNGDFTSHIALEFWDTRERKFFVLGVAIDTRASGETERPVFYKVENRRLPDLPLVEGDLPVTSRELRHQLSRLARAALYTTAEGYREAVANRLGHLSDRFFTVLTKGIAFQPMDDLRQFIYSYVLEERAVNIDVMRDNLQHYRQFQQLLEQTETKLAALAEISGAHREVQGLEETLRVQDYVIARAKMEDKREHLGQLEEQQRQTEVQLEQDRPALDQAKRAKGEVEARLLQLSEQKAVSQAQQAITLLETRLSQARSEANRLQGVRNEFATLASAEISRLRQALTLLLKAAGQPDANAQAPDWLPSWAEEAVTEALGRLESLLASASGAVSGGPIAPGDAAAPEPERLLSGLAASADRLGALTEAVTSRRFALQARSAELTQEQAGLERDLAALKQNRLVYDEHVIRLRSLIAEDGRRADRPAGAGKPAEPQVLCELLEIPDARWQDAVEGYLNTRRFDLIVPPEAFDRALAVYEGRKKEFKLHGVGLVNTGKMLQHLHDAVAGSLAEEVRTQNPYARAYVSRVLGPVMKCETEQELKQHRIAITPTCMTYQNHTARQIDPRVYATPFIGERALRRQREMKELRLREVKAEQAAVVQEQRLSDDLWKALAEKQERYARLAGLWRDAAQLPGALHQLQALERQLARVDRTELVKIEAEIQRANAEKQRLDLALEELQQRLIRADLILQQLAVTLPTIRADLNELERQLQVITEASPPAAEQGAQRYQAERRRRRNTDIIQGFSLNRESNLTKLNNQRAKLFDLRGKYNQAYQFGAAVASPDNIAYEAEQKKLAESELPNFRERIQEARLAAEEEFKEHFIHRLHEHLETAENAFHDLNDVLKNIRFGQDRYEFIARSTDDYRDYYRMIMDEYLMEGQSLFSQVFQEKYQATIEDLFRRMLDVPEEQQHENIHLLTDYRTYLEYDIRIHHEGGEMTLFSRVSHEKSGGETQTPYYVAMVASFLQVYRLPHNADSPRLMLFDEAFNRMDPDRVENMLGFMNQLGLQAIIAAPTDKLQLIAPHVPTTLLVMRDGHRVWLEDYHQMLQPREVRASEAAAGGEVPVAGEGAAAGEVAAADEIAVTSEAKPAEQRGSRR